jgi:dUTP pyrophosphatase
LPVLSGNTIQERELVKPGYMNYPIAYQPAGVDLRVAAIFKMTHGLGELNTDGSKRLPPLVLLEPYLHFTPIRSAYWSLEPGAYSCNVSEEIHMPLDAMAYLYSRSSLCRMGCYLETAIFDPGYIGVPSVMLVVQKPGGIRVEQGAPIGQLVFHTLDQETWSYSGSYQKENTQ